LIFQLSINRSNKKRMQKYKQKLILFSIIILFGIFALGGIDFALAQDFGEKAAGDIATTAGLSGGQDLRVIIGNIIRGLLGLLGAVALSFVLYGGYLYMTSAGEPGKVEKAKKVLINAGIGLTIIIASFAITTFIMSSLSAAVGLEPIVRVPPDKIPPRVNIHAIIPFQTRTMTPSGVLPIRNVRVVVSFNKSVAEDTITADTVKITDNNGNAVAGVYTVSGKVVVFVPNANCPEPNAARKCFESNTNYRVVLTPLTIKSIDDKGLSCIDGAVCTSEFTTGELVDVSDPVAAFVNPLSNDKLPVDDVAPVTIRGTDDAGVAVIEFFVGANKADEDGVAGGKNESANFDWNTTGVPIGQQSLMGKVFDFAGNESVDTISVKILPKECFDEAGEHVCGAEICGACEGEACEKDSDCGARMYCSENRCVARPVIRNVIPGEGAVQSFVSLTGSGFKPFVDGKSKVFFTSGFEGEVPNYIEGGMACAPTASWRDGQIVAVVPPGAVKGPIKIINRDSREDATDNDLGWKGDFIVNPNLTYPGLCLARVEGCVCEDVACANCEEGDFRQTIKLEGEKFGAAKNDESNVYFGIDVASYGAGSAWQDSQITGVDVPNLDAGFVDVKVGQGERCLDDKNAICIKGAEKCVCANVYSNPVQFRISELLYSPKIKSINPATGTQAQGITISGENFGVNVGTISFVDAAGAAVVAGQICDNAPWSETETVVAVPNLAPGDYQVILTTADRIPTAGFPFKIIEGLPGPTLCSLSPNNGPTGTVVKITGKNLGSDNLYNLKFSKKDDPAGAAPSSVGEWSATEISRAVASAESITGDVFLRDQAETARVGNALEFKVGECSADSCAEGEKCCRSGSCAEVCAADDLAGESEFAWVVSTGPIPKIPQVINRDCVRGYLSQSPSPASGESAACPNAIISAAFNMPMDKSTLFANNFIIRKCVNPADTKRCEEDTTKVCESNSDGCKCIDIGDCNLDTCEAGKCIEQIIPAISAFDIGQTNESATCLKAGKECEAGSEGCLCNLTGDIVTEVRLSASTLGLYALFFKDNQLFPNTRYQLIVKGEETGVKSLTGEFMPSDYSWNFKTKAESCNADILLMSPAKGVIDSLTAKQSFQICGQSRCEAISMAGKDWAWRAMDPDPIAAKARAIFESNPIESGTPRKDIGIFGIHSDFKANPVNLLETLFERPIKVITSANIGRNASGLTGNVSKQADLEIAFADPKVLSFYPNCEEACINSSLGASFNVRMNALSLSPLSVYLYKCAAGADCPLTANSEIVLADANIVYTPADDVVQAADAVIVSELQINPPANLLPNTFYRVIISGSAMSKSGVRLTGLNFSIAGTADNNSFSWVFKTKNSTRECELDKVSVIPQTYISQIKTEKIPYIGSPKSAPDACSPTGQSLNPFAYNWTWSSSNTNVATISTNVYKAALPSFCTDTCLSRGSTPIVAVCGNGKVEIGEECDDSNLIDGDKCSSICLKEPIGPECKNGMVYCGDGIKQQFGYRCGGPDGVVVIEECDLGCDFKGSDNKSCDPADATPEKPCVCVSRDLSCTGGCMNAGTAAGFVCGNGIKEPGEDADDRNTKNGDGVNNRCLFEGAKYKTTDAIAGAMCGNGRIEGGEECEARCMKDGAVCAYGSSNCTCTLPTNCSSICLITGFEACGPNKIENCCGDGILAPKPNLPNAYTEECEATCKKVCAPGAQDCENNAACRYGESNCICVFPSTCSNKCLNQGSNLLAGSSCQDGVVGPGEDAICDGDLGGQGSGQSPYQLASVVGTITALFDVDKGYAEEKTEIQALAREKVENPLSRAGKADLYYRDATCTAGEIGTELIVPGYDEKDVCRNAMVVLRFNQQVNLSRLVANPDLLTITYEKNDGACPEAVGAAGVLGKIKNFARNILGGHVLAAASCPLPIASINVSTSPEQKTIVTIVPKGLLPANTKVSWQLNGVNDKCGKPVNGTFGNTIFTTGAEICRVDSVNITPQTYFAVIPNQTAEFSAVAISRGQPIQSIPNIYSWNIVWNAGDRRIVSAIYKDGTPDDSVINESLLPDESEVIVQTSAQNGKTTVNASAVISADKIWRELGVAQNKIHEVCKKDNSTCEKGSAGCVCANVNEFDTTGSEIIGVSQVEVNICANRWDPTDFIQANWDLMDFQSGGLTYYTHLRERAHNVGLYYCRDLGDAKSIADDLPKLKETKVTQPLPNRNSVYVDSTDQLSYPINLFPELLTQGQVSTIEAWVYADAANWDSKPRILFSKTKEHCVTIGVAPNQSRACVTYHSNLYLKKVNGAVYVGFSYFTGPRDRVSWLTRSPLSNKYNHIAVNVGNVADVGIYINGQAQISDSIAPLSPLAYPSENIFVGSTGNGSNVAVGLDGYIDEFALWRTTRSAAEILLDVNKAPNPADPNLVIYSNFETNKNNLVTNVPAIENCNGVAAKCLNGKFVLNNLSSLQSAEMRDASGLWMQAKDQCKDNIDNDGDGLIDLLDPKCNNADDQYEEPQLRAQYFFNQENSASPDVISLRVYENPESLSPDIWYQKYAPNPADKTGVVDVDCMTDNFGKYCYQGAKDGTSVYVAAANLSNGKLYNNIYLLGYSQNSDAKTINIYTQLVNYLRFNMNADGLIDPLKIETIRDTKRVTDLVALRNLLNISQQENKKFPLIESGSFVRGKTLSIWPSWDQQLGTVLADKPAKDPENHLQWVAAGASDDYTGAVCPGTTAATENNKCLLDYQCVQPNQCVHCPPGYDKDSCYNATTTTFFNAPNAKHSVYDYSARILDAATSRTCYQLKYNLETADAAAYQVSPAFVAEVCK